MIIPETEKTTIVMNCNQEAAQEMGFKMSGFAYKLLSKDLYANIIRAIIRELSTNAWDSHAAAGHTKDFDVILPSRFEPIFKIRDYGTGMSEETLLYGGYNRFFDSDKGGSNEAVGMLGLGSKTPFSYTDQVSVTSWHGGMKKIYTSLIGENGIPSLRKVHEMESDEPNGVAVQFAVNDDDVADFSKEAIYVFDTFLAGSKPNLVNLRGSLNPPVRLHENLLVQTNNDGFWGLYVVQGNVRYPLDVGYGHWVRNTEIYCSMLRNRNYLIEVPIGTVGFTPSRETLNSSDSNIARLKPFFEAIDTYMESLLADDVAKLTNEFEARLFYEGSFEDVDTNYFRIGHQTKLSVLKKAGFMDGDFLTPNLFQIIKDTGLETNLHKGIGRYSRSGVDKLWQEDSKDDSEFYFQIYSASTAKKDFKVIVVDDKKRFRSRIRKYLKDKNVGGVVLPHQSADKLSQITDVFYWAEVAYTSSMEDEVKGPPKPKRVAVKHRWFGHLGGPMSGDCLYPISHFGLTNTSSFYYTRQVNREIIQSGFDGSLNVDNFIDDEILENWKVLAVTNRVSDEDLLKHYPNAIALIPAIIDNVSARFDSVEAFIEETCLTEGRMSFYEKRSRDFLVTLYSKLTEDGSEGYVGLDEFRGLGNTENGSISSLENTRLISIIRSHLEDTKGPRDPNHKVDTDRFGHFENWLEREIPFVSFNTLKYWASKASEWENHIEKLRKVMKKDEETK